ncbi:MAG TPA: alpha/beta hydrolase [Thermobifida alba]|nr:alpha/beta hydrolase [Thermobifida alba]
MGTKGWSGAVLAVALLATGCAETDRTEASEAEDPLAVFYGQDIDWQECDGRFECGTFEVPMDYDDPSGRRLEIAVKRLPASGSDRIGSLVVNPGGPGGSGLDYVSAAPAAFSRQVRERFDIVGFDPRGVGQSSPVYCMDSAELDEFLGFQLQSADGTGDPTAATDASVEEFVRLNRDFVEACQERSGELIHHVGTANVARDLDVLREVLGDDGLTYLGKSYGTSIGAHYAELFGANVRALVLDGAVTPHGDQLELSVEQAGGFTTALHAFVEDCLSRPDCPLADGDDATVADGVARIAELLERAAAEPLDNRVDGREVNRTRVELGVLAALYSESFWPQVRTGLTEAIHDGDGTVLLQLGDVLYSRDSDGVYENSLAALIAVNCADRPGPRDVAAYEEAARTVGRTAPLFGPSLAWGALTCAYWPKEAQEDALSEIDGDSAPPVLVVGTTRDSATPYEWAEEMAAALDSGVLLTWEGDGHTAYGSDPCVDDEVDAYLLEGEVPEDGTVCAL